MLIAIALAAAVAPVTEPLFDPATGYRIAHYRGVVGAPPPGVTKRSDAEAMAAVDAGKALLIDVTPADHAVRDGSAARWTLGEAHRSIPGAHWFPEAGRGPADAEIDAWFAKGIARLSHGRKARAILIFCRADCWMSWNAGWKLTRLGYRRIDWYANGIEGWSEAGRPLTPVEPEP